MRLTAYVVAFIVVAFSGDERDDKGPLEVGEACTLRSDGTHDCREGSSCYWGICRTICERDEDCEALNPGDYCNNQVYGYHRLCYPKDAG
jgi:hypothetical protein